LRSGWSWRRRRLSCPSWREGCGIRRRKWATERKYLPLKDVAAAGGWRDTETLLTSYQQPDDETLLAVMNEERKVRDRVQGLG